MESQQQAAQIVNAIRQHLVGRTTPLIVALDGGSGSGKSTISAAIADQLAAVVIPSDDFFAASIPDAEWDRRSPEERAADCVDWRRLRAEVIEPLRAGRPARWHAFDFAAGTLPDGTYPFSPTLTVREPAPVVVLDGIYTARPELADVIDLTVLVDVPVAERHARLAAREDAAFLTAWHARWDAAEEYYLTQVRPPSSFDLVV